MPNYLVTGVAGFIGSHLAKRLLAAGESVVGVDDLNDYYDVQLKRDRLAWLDHPRFEFQKTNLADSAPTARLFAGKPFDVVLHMAAQAGVRYSLENPQAYVSANLVGFANILEGCRASPPRHLVYASSSSVYGANTKTPFAVGDAVDHPLNLYAASKRANELMAYSYSHLFRLATTGLRFFTVYGPWGRPDMAVYRFCEAIDAGRPIEVYNSGKMLRDFTYVDDIVEGVLQVARRPPGPNGDSGLAPASLFNIGNSAPVELDRLITAIETSLGKKAKRINRDLQAGDMLATYADVEPLAQATGFRPATSLEEGVARFVAWFKNYHRDATKF